MDYKEEQQNEVEALEAIYCDEYNELSTKPLAFTLYLFSDDPEDRFLNPEDPDVITCSVVVKFSLPATYPDVVPDHEFLEYDGLEDDEIDDISRRVNSEAEPNLGMPMIFTLASLIKDRLTELADAHRNNIVNERDRERIEAEQTEARKRIGTAVTVESFMAWKTHFDKELESKKMQRNSDQVSKLKRLSGRQLFEKDRSLDASDELFFQER